MKLSKPYFAQEFESTGTEALRIIFHHFYGGLVLRFELAGCIELSCLLVLLLLGCVFKGFDRLSSKIR